MSVTANTLQKIREEIEAPLRAENAKLHAALEELILRHDIGGNADQLVAAWERARAALEETK